MKRSPRPIARWSAFAPRRIAGSLLCLIGAVLAVSGAHGKTPAPCPVVGTEQVSARMGPETRLLVSTPGGWCTWQMAGLKSLSLSVYREPDAAQAATRFDELRAGRFKTVTPDKGQPELGSKLFSGRAPEAEPLAAVAVFMVLEGADVVVLEYSDFEARSVPQTVLPLLDQLGRLAFAQRRSADQSYGSCEWIAVPQAEALLGAGRLTIHRAGPLSCSAALDRKGARVDIAVDDGWSEQLMRSMQAGYAVNCSVQLLPEFGESAYVEYGCSTPDRLGMSIHLLVGTRGAELVYTPSGRTAVLADLDRLRPLADHAVKQLQRRSR